MDSQVIDKKCEGPGCEEEFSTTRSDKKYCSYLCYKAASRLKSTAYMQKLRKLGIKKLVKLCKNCEEPFETTSLKKVYCKYGCYREATLEKNREYMARLRAEWREKYPGEPKEHECMLCDRMIPKRKKYCETCKVTALAIYREQRGMEVPEEG